MTSKTDPQPTHAQEMAEQRVAIVERMMNLPYIKATRDASVGQERFVARDDMITLIHTLAKESRAAAPAVEDAPREHVPWSERPLGIKAGEDATPRTLRECVLALRTHAHNAVPEDREDGVEAYDKVLAMIDILTKPDATPRTTVLQRAATWKESDLRKFPTATLELIDALVAALRAAPAVEDVPREREVLRKIMQWVDAHPRKATIVQSLIDEAHALLREKPSAGLLREALLAATPQPLSKEALGRLVGDIGLQTALEQIAALPLGDHRAKQIARDALAHPQGED
jgi:hypothetical protein